MCAYKYPYIDSKRKQSSPLSHEEAEQLLIACNEHIDHADNSTLLNNQCYTRYISALTIKFILAFGLANHRIINLPVSAYDNRSKQLKIDNYRVTFPKHLEEQVRQYLQFRYVVLSGEYEPHMFIRLQPDMRKLNNAIIGTSLQDIFGNYSSTAVAKYSIMQMIRRGLSERTIQKFTGYGLGVIGYCEEWVANDKLSRFNSEEEALNHWLMQMPLFQKG